MPQKKSGRLMPKSAALEAVASCQRLRCTADHTPSGTAQASAKAMDMTTISALAFIFCTSSGPIATLNIRDWPRWPVSMPPTQRAYCTTSGSFSPSVWRNPASAVGLLCVPSTIMATSPGRILVTANVMIEMSTNVSTIESRRLRM